jgi:hypothetical protein
LVDRQHRRRCDRAGLSSSANAKTQPTIAARDTLALVRVVLVVMLLLVGLVAGAHADVYSYADEDGVIHVTNIRPRGGKWKKVLDSAPPKGSKAAGERCPALRQSPGDGPVARPLHALRRVGSALEERDRDAIAAFALRAGAERLDRLVTGQVRAHRQA